MPLGKFNYFKSYRAIVIIDMGAVEVCAWALDPRGAIEAIAASHEVNQAMVLDVEQVTTVRSTETN